jgi:hypothetical protein
VFALLVAACNQGPGVSGNPVATLEPGATASPGATSGGGGGGSAACDLLTSDDILEITGFTVAATNPEPMDTIYANVCRWTFDGNPGSMDLGVLDVDAKVFFDQLVETDGGTEIAGLGDQAVRTEITGSVLALTGDTLLDLFVVGAGTSDQVEEQLIERALENLGG